MRNCRLCGKPIRFWQRVTVSRIPTKEMPKAQQELPGGISVMDYTDGLVTVFFHADKSPQGSKRTCAEVFSSKMDWWIVGQ